MDFEKTFFTIQHQRRFCYARPGDVKRTRQAMSGLEVFPAGGRPADDAQLGNQSRPPW